MEGVSASQLLHIPRWRWIVTVFCYFVLFHLFPLFFLSDPLSRFMQSAFWSKPVMTFIVLSCISIFISYRARSVVLWEPAAAAILYIVTLHLLFPAYLAEPTYLQNMSFIIECSILGFVFALGGAGIGFWLRRKYQIL